MLYATTRSNSDPVTAHRALTDLCAPDGGLYIPYHLPELTSHEIAALKDKTFGQTVADILNLFFGCRLDGWDVEFAIGRYPVRCVPMSHRIVIAETWHNLDWNFARMSNSLVTLVAGSEIADPGDWAVTAVRIAVLFGILAELMRTGMLESGAKVDISVASGDFSAPMAAWYARKMGLPIASIVVCCNENSAPWDLICKGELRTGIAAVPTATPDCDQTLPKGLERFISACGGEAEVSRYLDSCRRGEVYIPSEDVYPVMRRDTHASVVGGKRVLSAIPNLYKTNSYLPGPYTALAYSGMLDYRARTGESRLAIVLSEQSPVCHAAVVSAAMGIRPEELDNLL